MGDVSMQSKCSEALSYKQKITVSSSNEKYTQFISGSMDMKSLLQKLIACRVDKRYAH